ncbi:biotin-dependent carboxyltransferase family protein [Kallotenue papyrolyticum]|uniref:5-oxoprolinase subunit C family protein n=1 Tax=Kallotenue papyrolyticum TaxID=1325125 RepID=UPI0004708E2E|nr:5-oxoprolinase/urea amidolyase family protein [Kallotenue papyrolyticum]
MSEARPALRVIGAGPLTTVQDGGRVGWRRLGVPVSGAMDPFALRVANRLVGNPPGAAALEITAGGASFEVLSTSVVALTGAEVMATLDGAPLPLWTSVLLRPGAVLVLGQRRADWGARAYLALAGGIAVPELLGSRSTYLPGGWGGLDGRPLQGGDLLCAAPPTDLWPLAGQCWPPEARPAYCAAPVLRAVPGPHEAHFMPEARTLLTSVPWRVSAQANRQGYRLKGPPLPVREETNLPSLGVLPGVIQVPPDGQPILLMADAQTTGGYPIIATVIEPDLPLAAQLLPGDELRLRLIDVGEACAVRQQWASLLATPLPADPNDLVLRLAGG